VPKVEQLLRVMDGVEEVARSTTDGAAKVVIQLQREGNNRQSSQLGATPTSLATADGMATTTKSLRSALMVCISHEKAFGKVDPCGRINSLRTPGSPPAASA
jgi:hypothetical protein